jgi:hypothetical protein
MGSISDEWVSLGLVEIERGVPLRLFERIARRSGAPTWNEGILNPKLIADARDHEIDQVA